MLYPTWATTPGRELWYPINMYTGIEIFGGVASAMSLGIDYNGYNPWNWAAPHIFYETEQQHTGWGTGASSAARPISERWYNLAMQNYYGIKAFCTATLTGEFKNYDPADYYKVPYSGTRPATPSSRDYNVAQAAALTFSWMDARYTGTKWAEASVDEDTNELTVTVYEQWTDKSVRAFDKTVSVGNNAVGAYIVEGSEDSLVYVEVKNGLVVDCFFWTPITSLNINALAITTVRRGEKLSFGLQVNEGARNDKVVWATDPTFGSVDHEGNVTIYDRTGNMRLTATDPISGITHSVMLRIAS